MTKIGLNRSSAVVSLRSVVLGSLLIPLNNYFIMWNHLRYWSTLPTTISLIYNVVITVVVLVSLNIVIRIIAPEFVFQRGELLTIYTMLSIGSVLAGHDMIQTIMPTISDGFWFATPENEWQKLFGHHLPVWLVINDTSVLPAFYFGESTFYTFHHLSTWFRPIMCWAILLIILTGIMICLSALLSKQWIRNERLAYPVIQLPLEITYPNGRLFKSKMMWLGFAIAGSIDLINGVHVFLPVLPQIPVRQVEIGQYVTEKPWTAIGWTPLYILSFAVGLGFLMPVSMSFSVWFFYLFWKFERVLGQAMGLGALPRFPYERSQVMGGYLALAIMSMYHGKRYFWSIIKSILTTKPTIKHPRWAIWGLIGGLILLFFYSNQNGMSFWVSPLYFLFYFLLSVGITRVRAEVGPPTNEVSATPHHFLVDLFGSRRLARPTLTAMSLYGTFNRGSRAHVMPHILEGFKVIDNAGGSSMYRIVFVMLLATVIGVFSACWSYLDVGYQIGVSSDIGVSQYNMLRNWLYYPTEMDMVSVSFMVVGALVVNSLWWLRNYFPLSPFHPAGYVIGSSNWTGGWLWFSIFMSWLIKITVLRFGGIRLYRRVYPIFLGLLLGEFIVGGSWVLFRLFSGLTVYSFYR